jgi:hypothetical protein
MNHRHMTSGERLAALIHDEHLNDSRLTGIATSLTITGRPEQYARYFRELAAVSVACRLVAYACGLSDHGNDGKGMNDDNPIFKTRLTTYIREYLGVYDKAPFGKLYRHVIDGRRASLGDIPAGVKRSIQSAAKRKLEKCYMCGQAFTHDNPNSNAAITIDHIWPQCFGGESEEDNLLPACNSCNTCKKRNFATWSMVAIQSVALGWNPQRNARVSLDGSVRFARHHLAVWIEASNTRCSLKEAYRRIGPWTDVGLLDADNDGDFFNIQLVSSSKS